jgi:hypothetical protein
MLLLSPHPTLSFGVGLFGVQWINLIILKEYLTGPGVREDDGALLYKAVTLTACGISFGMRMWLEER